jgi:DNA-binding Lrp family transcriptional regulator
MAADALHALDIVVALRLAESPRADFRALADDLALSVSTAHAAVRRLMIAGLVRSTATGVGAVNRHALIEFLEHGVRYAFPAVAGAPTRGVPTAHAGPVFADVMDAADALVWEDPQGAVQGRALAPLIPRAGQLAKRAPVTYALLTAVDALRIGRARERDLARRYIREVLKVPSPGQPPTE